MQSSTVRSEVDPTIVRSRTAALAVQTSTKPSYDPEAGLERGLVSVLRDHPSILRDRSHLMNLVCEDYVSRDGSLKDLDLDEHCQRFEQFGSSIRRTIQRQLEVLRYIDARTEPTKWPEAGDRFGQFQIVEELGRGAVARVYLCLEEDLGNRPVAVKVTPLPSGEASILGQLMHKNIIPIHSTGYVDDWDLSYLCMSYRGRSTLSDVVDFAFHEGCPLYDTAISFAACRWAPNDALLPNDEKRPRKHLVSRPYVDAVLDVVAQIADALHHAHKLKIVHGDLKPSNVLITPVGVPLLLDFNLSRGSDVDHMSVCGGTLPYMSPEQLQIVASETADDDAQVADPKIDVYSFGSLIFELFAGVTPYHDAQRANDLTVVAKNILERMSHGVPSVRKYNCFVSRELDALVRRCLARDPNDRPSSMAEVILALKKERRFPERLRRQVRLRPLFFACATILALATMSAVGFYTATRPPRYLSNYEAGLRFASNHAFEAAADYFAKSARQSPDFVPAKFELGRTHVAQGAIDLALDDFRQVMKQQQDDAKSMAYVGYCFNRKNIPTAAIPWYELAIKNGCNIPAVLNNLGASYLEGNAAISVPERLQRAEDLLLKANTANPSATTRLNLIRFAVAKSKWDPSYDPSTVWPHVRALVQGGQNDLCVDIHLAKWYHAVLNRGMVAGDAKSKPESFAVNASDQNRLVEIYHAVHSKNPLFTCPAGIDVVGRCILEPIPSSSPTL